MLLRYTLILVAKLAAFLLLLTPVFSAAAPPNGAISISVTPFRVERGQTVEIMVVTPPDTSLSRDQAHAVILRPSAGVESLALQPGKPGEYRATFLVSENAASGLYAVHAWMGKETTPTAIGKSTFLVGKIVGDFFIPGRVDPDRPQADLAEYLQDFSHLGGNLLIAHALVTEEKAYYPSAICKTDITPGSANDLVEALLRRGDSEGFAVLLSVGWDMTRNSPHEARMEETKALMKELYNLYGHHPSLVGFYAYQEGSGTYLVPYLREFCNCAKSLNAGLLTGCAPYVDDPLLAGYLSTLRELDVLIFQGMVMASYRPDNRKKYPLRRVRDFCSLGAGAKRLQNKIALTHVELFGYLEEAVNHRYLTNYGNIYQEILSAATVAENDGIVFFAYHPVIYESLKKYPEAQCSRQAVLDGMQAFGAIAPASHEPNPLAVYFPYSDWVIERWSECFLPALDAFRELGIPVNVLPYAPPLSESLLPYFPMHLNPDVLNRLLQERTVLVLPNVSGFQQTDSDLIKALVQQGGALVAFGPQIPMGISYDQREVFGGEPLPSKLHTLVRVREAAGSRAAAGSQQALGAVRLAAWRSTGAKVVATFEDGSAAALVNRYGKGTVVTVVPDAMTAARRLPELVRDLIDVATSSVGVGRPVDILGANSDVDLAATRTPMGFRVAVVNHNLHALQVTFRPSPSSLPGFAEWYDLSSQKRIEAAPARQSLTLRIAPGEFRSIEFRRRVKPY